MAHRFFEGELPVGYKDRRPRFEGRIKTTHGAGIDDIFDGTDASPPMIANEADSEPVFAPDHDDVTNKIVLGVTALGLLGIASGVAWRKIKKRRAGEE